ncbi:MAG: aspartate aminotransferase family protein, partial [Actinobacteria bacterium]|nr:aspartate aminotransferase family protein [Actinomycetota bacterium]
MDDEGRARTGGHGGADRGEAELFARLEAFRAGDLDTKGGRTWAYVYDPGRADVDRIAKRALVDFYDVNALDPTVFPSLLRLENEVVGAARDHLRGGPGVVGNFTTGGTESIMMTVKVARDRARHLHPEIARPTMVVPVTAHAAFHKAAHYFDLDVVSVPVDTTTWKADVDAMADACDDRTVLLVGSAVSYAHGVIDPIPELGQLALERDVLLHVDGCIGGFILPYLRRLGRPTTDFDFSVPGVTSISMDFHKYAYCPKGASVVLYRDADLRRYQLYAKAAWTGYTVINTTFQSTKSGGALAATWAALEHVGDAGYLEIAERTMAAVDAICAGVADLPDLEVMVPPESNLVALVSDTVNVFDVVDQMRRHRWYVQPQLGFAGSRENIHLSVGGASLALVPDLLADLAEACAAAKADPTPPPDPAVVELLHSIDPEALDGETFDLLLAGAGLGDAGDGAPPVPEATAGINALLNV